MQARPEPLGERAHVGVAAAGDVPPLVAPEAEHAVVVEEPDRRRGGVLERAARRRRPERGRQRNEKVPPEAAREASLVEVASQRQRVVEIRERALCGQEPASDLPEQREEPRVGGATALRERPPARVLEAAGARDRERHLRRLGRDAELREESRQERVVAGVVDEEARVEREPVAPDRAGVTAGALVALEDLDVVRALEHVRGPQPGDAAADDRDLHEPYSRGGRIPVVIDAILHRWK